MKILIIQLRRIGDILLTTPVIAALKKNIPNAEIDFLCEPSGKEVLETHPDLHQLLIFKKGESFKEILGVRSMKYDVVLDFMNNPRTAWISFLSEAKYRLGFRHRLRRIFYSHTMPEGIPPVLEYVSRRKIRMTNWALGVLGVKSIVPQKAVPALTLTKEDLDFAHAWQKSAVGNSPCVVFAPVSRYPIRMWRLEAYLEVARELKKEGIKIFVAWGPSEKELLKSLVEESQGAIEFLPTTTLRQMAAIIKDAKFVLSSTSGTMHLAVSVGTPTITIYGPNRPNDWENPDAAVSLALTAKDVPCLGCHLTAGCPNNHICMTNLTAKEVYTACQRLLKKETKV